MTADMVRTVASTLKRLGCQRVHIGGGEPFLAVDGLREVVETATAEGLSLEYVETNSYWYTSHDSACALLERLQTSGLTSLLVSISPMHAGFVPPARAEGVLRACQATGVGAVPWVMDFLPDLAELDRAATHPLQEFERRLGPGYLARIPQRYWVHLGGRALATFGRFLPRQTVGELVAANPRGCRELERTEHFHLDLYGDFVPGLCAGLAIDQADLGVALDPDQYPVLTALHQRGIRGLLEIGQGLGFVPSPAGYVSKCHLCDAVRRHLVHLPDGPFPELRPREFYPPQLLSQNKVKASPPSSGSAGPERST
jgi:hypothetical protein